MYLSLSRMHTLCALNGKRKEDTDVYVAFDSLAHIVMRKKPSEKFLSLYEEFLECFSVAEGP